MAVSRARQSANRRSLAGAIGAGIIAPGGGRAGRYMIASSRHVMAGDWGTGSNGFTTNNDVAKWDGGTATVSSKYQYRRVKVRTSPWGVPLTEARHLFDNSAMSIYGVRPSKFAITIQRAEYRDMSDNLVEVCKFNGAGSYTLQPLIYDFIWHDPLAGALLPDTDYWLDLYDNSPDGSAFPVMLTRYLAGECSTTGNSDLSLTTPNKTQVFTPIGGMFGPSCFLAKGCPAGRAVALLIGTSIADYTTDGVPFINDRGVSGFIQKGLNANSQGARIDVFSAARFSTNMSTVYQDNLGDGQSGVNGPTRSLVTHLKAIFGALGQSKPPFNVVVSEHGRNDVNRGFAAMKIVATAMYNAIRQAWPGIPIAQTTTPPSTNFGGAPSNNTAWTTEADQTADANNGTTGSWADWTAWVLAGGDGLINVSIDSAAPIRNGSKWKEQSFSATFLDAAAQSLDLRTATVRLSAQAPVGATLVFEPGTANTGSSGLDFQRSYNVLTTAANANGGFDTTLRPASRSPSFADFTKSGGPSYQLQYGHAAGATVKLSLTNDGIHPNEMAQGLMAAQVTAAKPAIASLAAAYEAAA
ncbi:hypothetical protein NS365_04515 [Aureimonas ureilytica]|uniref:Uncharacterized protein n=2 Tax=Aureimonas ureilytica TaxID=401562 RepID=A0A175RUC9_9HYPH|nr:hypothetical protein NS365_04515 [Aureimonas ureilytica]